MCVFVTESRERLVEIHDIFGFRLMFDFCICRSRFENITVFHLVFLPTKISCNNFRHRETAKISRISFTNEFSPPSNCHLHSFKAVFELITLEISSRQRKATIITHETLYNLKIIVDTVNRCVPHKKRLIHVDLLIKREMRKQIPVDSLPI